MPEQLSIVEYHSGRPAGAPHGTLVLLHGFPVDHRMWDACARHLSAYWRVIALDLPGLGNSPVPSGPVSINESARLVAQRIAAVAPMHGVPGSSPIVVAGLSMGGYVAQALVRLYPTMFDGLILLDTRVTADGDAARENRLRIASAAEEVGSSDPVLGMATSTLSPETVENRPDVVEFMEDLIRSQSASGVAWSQRAMAARVDSSALIARYTNPALIVVGEDDAVSPPEVMEQIARTMPVSHCEVIAHAGHMTPVEQPEAVARAINAFLARLSVE